MLRNLLFLTIKMKWELRTFLVLFTLTTKGEASTSSTTHQRREKNVNMATSSSDTSLPQGGRAGVKTGDSKHLREVDRIIAWTFWEAKDEPPGTISRPWVAKFLKSSETFVKDNWRTDPYRTPNEDEPEQKALSQESKVVILGLSGHVTFLPFTYHCTYCTNFGSPTMYHWLGKTWIVHSLSEK